MGAELNAELNAKTQGRKDARDIGGLASLRPGDLALSEGFRDTLLGPLPETWDVVSLGDLGRAGVLWMKNGYPQGSHNQEGEGVPHLRPFNVTNAGTIDLSQIKYVRPPGDDSPYWVQKGDVIFNNTNSEELVGKTAYFPFDGRFVLSNHMTAIRVLDANIVDAYWLSQELLYRWREGYFQSLCRRHVNQASISLARLHGVQIPLLPLSEQRAIAHVLRTVQEALEATGRVIAAARELKRSLMRHLFAYGPVPVAQADQVELQETEVGPIPAHWRTTRLAEVTEKPQYGYTASAMEEPVGPKLLRITDIQDGRVLWGTVPYCDIGEKDIDKYLLSPGDILIARIGATTGKTYLVTQCPESVFASYLIRVRVRSGLIASEYLHHFTNTQGYWTQINASKGGRLKQGVNIPVLQSLLLPLPPLLEQDAIVRTLATVDAKIAAEEVRRGALEALFHTLLHHLMTGKIRTQGRKDARTQSKT